MIFNDFGFLFGFLPIVLVAFYWIVPAAWRLGVLLAASFTFYAMSGLQHAAVLLIGIIWVYALAAGPGIVGNRARLALAVVGPIAALVYYKYLGFLAATFDLDGGPNERFSLFRDIVLPAGISFFTFQLVAFAVDRFRGELKEPPSPGRFALYISFFPQLVAGPILRYHDVAAPLAALRRFTLTKADAGAGIAYIVLGLAAKVLIADTLGNYIDPWIKHPEAIGTVTAIYVLLAYSFQIYFDFYGYSLVAIGLGRLFGFHFPDNFRRPYESPNIREFWRRWHITLSFWIRDYLYLPLGGNRRYLRNIVIVFAVCGLWHGAGWTFVIWGLYHGFLVVLYHIGRRWWDVMPRLLQVALTFVLVSLGWSLFVFDFAGITRFFTSLAGLGNATAAAPALEHWLVLAAAALACFVPSFERMAARAEEGLRLPWASTLGYSGLFVAVVLFINRSHDFIYFRF
jgi:alginate O-acetyltransferase complex protein AlgI